MHDNTWARALMAQGIEVSLIPAYTPLRLDEQSTSLNRVFLGGVNVYLNEKWNWWSKLPRVLTSWLDRPSFIRLVTSRSISNDAAELGELTLSLMRGEHGPHRAAIQELAEFLSNTIRPDAIIFSNALLSGALHEIRQACPVPILCTLQGDDVFLDGLPDQFRTPVIARMSECAREFDGFITHSAFYRDYIANYLSLPVEKFHILPLGIDLAEHTGQPKWGTANQFVVGYFARFAPEKGLHHLIDAFEILQQKVPDAKLRIGGYQGPPYQNYTQQILTRLKRSGLPFINIGSPQTVEEKAAFLSQLDVLSVPTDFLEPKGMPVLEAMANGVPVVQPAHGAFPEMIQSTGGGKLVPPKNPQALAEALAELANPELRFPLAEQAWHGVRQHYGTQHMAQRTIELLTRLWQ